MPLDSPGGPLRPERLLDLGLRLLLLEQMNSKKLSDFLIALCRFHKIGIFTIIFLMLNV